MREQEVGPTNKNVDLFREAVMPKKRKPVYCAHPGPTSHPLEPASPPICCVCGTYWMYEKMGDMRVAIGYLEAE